MITSQNKTTRNTASMSILTTPQLQTTIKGLEAMRDQYPAGSEEYQVLDKRLHDFSMELSQRKLES